MFSCSVAQQPTDSYILSLMNAQHMPGTAALVIRDGKWIWYRNWGKADIPKNIHISRDQVFMLASISKTMIVTSLMQLWERGLFKLDDNINRYLPFEIHNPKYPNDTITFRMFLAHVSGIQDNNNVLAAGYVSGDSKITLDSFLFNYFVPGKTLYDSTLNFYRIRSGSRYHYSNVGATLAAYLAQRISGIPYDVYCNTHIFGPLCMDHTSFKLADFPDTTLIVRPYSLNGKNYVDNDLYGYPDYPDGQLRTTIASLARFMIMYMNHGMYNGVKILDSTTVDMIMTEQFPLVKSAAGQGLTFYQNITSNGDTLWGHNGGDGGVSTDMYFNYKNKIGIIVFGNGDGYDTTSVDPIWDTIYRYAKTLPQSLPDSFPPCTLGRVQETELSKKILSVRCFPDPTTSLLHIELSNYCSDISEIFVLNIEGKKIRSFINQKGEKITISLNDLARGAYLLQVKNGDDETRMKFLKE